MSLSSHPLDLVEVREHVLDHLADLVAVEHECLLHTLNLCRAAWRWHGRHTVPNVSWRVAQSMDECRHASCSPCISRRELTALGALASRMRRPLRVFAVTSLVGVAFALRPSPPSEGTLSFFLYAIALECTLAQERGGQVWERA